MAGEEPASTRYEVSEPVALRLSAAKWLWALVEAIFLGPTGTQDDYRHKVTDRINGRVVYEVKTDSAVADRSAQELLRHDLSTMTLADFEKSYGIWSRE